MSARHLASLSTCLALACGGGGAGDKIMLRYHPPAGASQQLAIEQEIGMRFEGGPMAEMGEQRMTTQMFVTQAVAGPVEGGTAVTVTFDSMHVSSPMLPPRAMEQALRQMRGVKGDLVLDERMRVVRASFTGVRGVPADISQQLGSSVRGASFSIPFPARAVGVGDKWTETVEVPLGEIPGNKGPIKATTEIRVLEIRVQDGDTIVVLDVGTRLPTDPIAMSAEGEQGTITFAGVLAGDQEFSLPRGAVISGTMGGEVRITVSSPSSPGTMTMVMNQRLTMRALGGAPSP